SILNFQFSIPHANCRTGGAGGPLANRTVTLNRILPNFQFSILNFQFSIPHANCRTGGIIANRTVTLNRIFPNFQFSIFNFQFAILFPEEGLSRSSS
ncbi:MAG: hypothetical protein WCJ35_21515, partial [Planctomycetota bacterium]